MVVHFEFSVHCGISFVVYSQKWRTRGSQDSCVASRSARQCPPHTHTHTQKKKLPKIRKKRENVEKEKNQEGKATIKFSLHCGFLFVLYSQVLTKCRSQDSVVARKGGGKTMLPPHTHTHTQRKMHKIRKMNENLEKLGRKDNNQVFLALWDFFCFT